MASGNLLEFNESNFDAEVLQSAVPVLVDFWAEWCRPCQMLTPIVQKIADAYAGKAKIGKVDTDTNRDLALKYRINTIPTLLLFKGGQLVEQMGFRSEADIRKSIDAHL